MPGSLCLMSDFKIIPGFGIMETALVRRLARTGRLRVRDNAAMYRYIINLRKKLPRSVVIVVRRDAKARDHRR